MMHLSLFSKHTTIVSTITALVLLPALSASAAMTHYSDVQSGVWYEQSAANLLSSGALDASQTKLRPNDIATRAEMFKMMVDVDGTVRANPLAPSFTDVPRSATSFRDVETAAREGWLQGDNNCYGKNLLTCTASPRDQVNRAEMAMLLKRSFNLLSLNVAPTSTDVARNQWYFSPIQAAADHCIMRGDDTTGLMRPASPMNRSEMIVMFDRASRRERFGVDCGDIPDPAGAISSVSVISPDTVQLSFSVDLDPNFESQLSHYAIEWASNGDTLAITSVRVLNSRIVELTLGNVLNMGVQYRIAAKNMRSQRGVDFNSTRTFTSDKGINGSLESVTAVSSMRLRLVFSGDLNVTDARQLSHYRVSNVSGNLDISSAALTSDNVVELFLEEPLQSQQIYTVTVEGLNGTGGMNFSGNTNIIYNQATIPMHVILSGNNQIPHVTTNATGVGDLTLTSTGLQFDITLSQIDDAAITAAHFHRGSEDDNGPILKEIVFNGLRATGTWTTLSSQDREDILSGNIYVNVHSSLHTDGEIRGQIEGE